MRKTFTFICLSTVLLSTPLPVWADTYTVVKGDTLSKIARQYQTSADQLRSYNQLPSDRLSIGQVLSIPGADTNAAPAEAYPNNAPVSEPPAFLGLTPASAMQEVSETSTVTTETLYVTVPSLNVRAFPSTESAIVGKVSYGMQLDVVEKGTEWLTVQYNGTTAYVAAEFVAAELPKASPASVDHDFVMGSADAKELMPIIEPLLGIPYRLGGTTLDGFDCSGFTSYVMAKLGVKIPRTSEEQFASGEEVPFEKAVPGDLLFYDALQRGTVSHVALYLGNGTMVHANGDQVRFEKVENMNKLYPFYGVKRYLNWN
ncbi:C40 family peptidase [Brevibacillus migulae]|uniref:C40 family peptidase n=1 Tax=Brevibacillus migulae TaxID=1644114 RepID=UPI00106E1D4A|nr:NlpC/P60 family protein [Brevibacillus migulae]